MFPTFFTPLGPKNWNAGGSKFGVILRAPVLPIQQPPNYALGGMLDGWIRATKHPHVTDLQVFYNQENFKNVKIHFLQQKNHNFFVKQVMKTLDIPLTP